MRGRKALESAGSPLRRIAFFCEQGHPAGHFRSGVTRLANRLVAGCARRGVEVDYFTYLAAPGETRHGTTRYWAAPPRITAGFHGLEVDALDLVPVPNRRLRAGLLPGRRYDVIVGTAPGIGTQGQLLARSTGRPFVGIYTTDLPHYAEALFAGRAGALGSGPGQAARGFATRYLSWLYHRDRTDRVLVPTAQVREDLLSFVDAEAGIMGRGADTLVFEHVGERPDREPVRALYVGRIDYGQKNLATLEPLLDHIPGLELTLVGGGDDLHRLRRRFQRHVDAGRAVITGRIDDPEALRRTYLQADLFVFPSVSDTLGQVVLEAQAAGLPVVVRDRGGPKELIDPGVTGFVTDSDEAFLARVRTLAGDGQLRRTMGAAARRHALEAPTWDDIAGLFVDQLAAVVARAARQRSSRRSSSLTAA